MHAIRLWPIAALAALAACGGKQDSEAAPGEAAPVGASVGLPGEPHGDFERAGDGAAARGAGGRGPRGGCSGGGVRCRFRCCLGRGRRVAARKRGAERLRDRVEVRSDPVCELLDRPREDVLAEDHAGEVSRHPARLPPTEPLPEHDRDRGEDDEPGLAEHRDELQCVVGEGGCAVEPPLRDALVELDEPVTRPDEVREHRESEPSDQDHPESERQREPGGHLGVQTDDEEPPEPAVLREGVPHGLRRRLRGMGRNERRGGEAPDGDGHERTECEREGE